jgi:predicted ATPase/class 3 adenylate cyclase/Tfp pilus assembly protein PilF
MTRTALLFTDVVDSTRLVERLGDTRAGEVWAEHDRRARQLLERHHGREIDRTDGFFLLFDEPSEAARYALAYHEALSYLALSARAGLHVGTVSMRENAPADIARGAKPIEVEGVAKPLAARIMSLARGGQTLLSAAAQKALGDILPDGSEFESHGHYRLKGVEQPVEVFELGVRDGAPFAPPADADKAYRVVRVGDLWRTLREVRHNLPAERDAFVGRRVELWRLAQRLDAGARLLTVLGSAGSGKTRFVRRYGWTWLGDWSGGVYFCDLSEARSLDGILFAAASALDVPLGKDDPVLQLGHAMAGRGRCLIVLDNFEQVLSHAPATLGHWLDRAADAAFVVTSRERLHLPGEEIVPIEPLPLDQEAIELFTVRARAQRADFVLGEANRAAVADVVRLLDGLPLAIELAAARARVLSPVQLVKRLRDRFHLLTGVRGATARQATLRAAIDWSWDLLAPWEQAALAQCSVFEGGFTLDAAEAVLDLAVWPKAPAALDAVEALVDKSLLRTWVPAEQGRLDIDEPYFGMYVSIHEYAREKMDAAGPQATCAAEERHGRYFSQFGTEEAIDALSRAGGTKRRRALALELDNLLAACRRAITRRDSDTAAKTHRAAWEVLELRGPVTLATTLGFQVLALDGIQPADRVAALATFAMASQRAGRMLEAESHFDQALALARSIRDRASEGKILSHMGTLPREQGSINEARRRLEDALDIHREVGDRRWEGIVLGNLANLDFEHGRLNEARHHYEAALAIHREVGNRRVEGSVLGNLALLHSEQGHLAEAHAQYEAALATHREVGSRRFEGTTLGNLGMLYQQQGRLTEAQKQYEAALAIHRSVGNRRDEGIVLGNLGIVDFEQGRLHEAQEHYEAARSIAREVGYPRAEGAVLASLGELLAKLGRLDEARKALLAGELLLREVGDRLGLGKLLCILGQVAANALELDRARTALSEAEVIALEIDAGPASELGIAIINLRQRLS